MKMKEILLEYESLIPQPRTLKVDVSSYEFIQLMKQFRSDQETQGEGDSGLVMFYTEQEKQEFTKFLNSKGVKYKDIGSN